MHTRVSNLYAVQTWITRPLFHSARLVKDQLWPHRTGSRRAPGVRKPLIRSLVNALRIPKKTAVSVKIPSSMLLVMGLTEHKRDAIPLDCTGLLTAYPQTLNTLQIPHTAIQYHQCIMQIPLFLIALTTVVTGAPSPGVPKHTVLSARDEIITRLPNGFYIGSNNADGTATLKRTDSNEIFTIATRSEDEALSRRNAIEARHPGTPTAGPSSRSSTTTRQTCLS